MNPLHESMRIVLLNRRARGRYLGQGSTTRKAHMSKVWFITGAGSGIGAGTARAALKAGDRVVVTGRDARKIRDAYGILPAETLAVIELDVTNEAQAKAAVDEAVKRFGR